MRKPIAHAVFALALLIAASWKPAQAGSVQIPPATRAKLGNGLEVIVIPTARLPLVDFRLVARAGSVDDPAGKEGLAALTAELMTQGAGGRDARTLAEDIDFVGGTLGASAAAEQVVVTCEVLKKDFSVGLELFRDVIVSPTFPAAEFERKKDETLGGIAADRNDPGTVASQALGPYLLGASPLAHPIAGWEKSVRTLTREDVVTFHDQRVRPDRAWLAVVGDVDPKTTIAALEKAFAGWKKSSDKWAEAYQAVPQVKGRTVLIVNKPEVTQTQIRLACIGVPRNHPDFYPIVVANTILGSGFTSRLVNEVRVNQGLTYSIGSRFGMYRNAGTFTVNTFTRNETIRKTIDAVLTTEKKLLDEGPTEEELAKARTYLTGQYPLGLQAPDALAAQVINVEFFGLDPQYLQTYQDKIAAVSMTDVRRALKSYFCVDDLRILLVSNPEVAKKQLDGLGPIEVRDPE
jgi:zinc protease